jgi:hypothetical protein
MRRGRRERRERDNRILNNDHRGPSGQSRRWAGSCIHAGGLFFVGVQRLLQGGQYRSSGQAENYACKECMVIILALISEVGTRK